MSFLVPLVFTEDYSETNTQGSDTHTSGAEQSDRQTALQVTHSQARRSRVPLSPGTAACATPISEL